MGDVGVQKSVADDRKRRQHRLEPRDGTRPHVRDRWGRKVHRLTGGGHSVDPASLPGAVPAKLPTAIVPMKSSLTDTPPKGDDWLGGRNA